MPYYNRDPKRDHNFDNHPYRDSGKENGSYYNIIGYITGFYKGRQTIDKDDVMCNEHGCKCSRRAVGNRSEFSTQSVWIEENTKLLQRIRDCPEKP